MTFNDPQNTAAAPTISTAGLIGPFRTKRLLLAILLLVLAAAPGLLGETTRAALEDAYIAVAVFVAMTLALFYGAERVFGFNINDLFRRFPKMQVPLASFLGALPGCGGAVVVVAAYSSGSISMGAVVATLTATMGDAAFLLIATRPDAAVVLLPVALCVGIISGYIVDIFDKRTHETSGVTTQIPMIPQTKMRKSAYLVYGALAVPGLIFGIMDLLQVEFHGATASFITILAMVGIGVGMLIWAASPVKTMTDPSEAPLTRVAEETSFITAWVILAFLLFEYLIAFAGLDLLAMFNTIGIALPLIAILIGFIPGCGPQILVTTFYINGLVPFAALMGNAIANDGDALFPAIALNPRVAFLATVYSAIPAIIVAYGFYVLAPNYLTP